MGYNLGQTINSLQDYFPSPVLDYCVTTEDHKGLSKVDYQDLSVDNESWMTNMLGQTITNTPTFQENEQDLQPVLFPANRQI